MDFSNIVTKAKNSITDYLGIPDNDRAQGPFYSNRITNAKFFQYTITSSQNGQFSSRLPKELSLSLTAKFADLLSQRPPLLDNIDKVMQSSGFGISSRTKFTTAQIWQGSEPVKLTLPIELIANENVDREVLLPIIRLSSMVLPREGGNNKLGSALLRPPGPHPIDLNKASMVKEAVDWLGSTFGGGDDWNSDDTEDNITVNVGNILTLRRCIITKVDWKMDLTRILANVGKPMAVTGNIDIKTSYAITNQDFQAAIHANSVNKADALMNQMVKQKGK